VTMTDTCCELIRYDESAKDNKQWGQFIMTGNCDTNDHGRCYKTIN